MDAAACLVAVAMMGLLNLLRRRYRVNTEYLWLGGYGRPAAAAHRSGRRFWKRRTAERWAKFYDRTAWECSGSITTSTVERLSPKETNHD